jgi:Cu(I)/Ag(I) efflux system membrane protein CusA/SilA
MVVPLTLGIIVVMLYLALRNVTEVMILVGTLPLALVGGVWLLYWMDYDLSVAVGVGFIALAGVAIETAVVMLVYLDLSYAARLEQAAREGRTLRLDELREAVVEGALLRVRPKMMTVATIIAGLFPIMIGAGSGSEVMRRIAAPMMGGIISATALTLVAIPAVFYLWRRRGLDRV